MRILQRGDKYFVSHDAEGNATVVRRGRTARHIRLCTRSHVRGLRVTFWLRKENAEFWDFVTVWACQRCGTTLQETRVTQSKQELEEDA